MHTHVCHSSNKCVRAFNVDQFIPYSSMFYSQLVISSSPYFLISDIFSVYMILTINHLQRLLFDTSLYLLTLLSNVAEAKPLYAAAMAHYDVLEGLDKCHLKILYQPEELSSSNRAADSRGVEDRREGSRLLLAGDRRTPRHRRIVRSNSK